MPVLDDDRRARLREMAEFAATAPLRSDLRGSNAPMAPSMFGSPVSEADPRVSSGYGARNRPTAGASTFHRAYDVVAPTSGAIDESNVVAVAPGTVVRHAGPGYGGYGGTAFVDHGGGVVTRYSHMDDVGVSVGDRVEQGQRLGSVGGARNEPYSSRGASNGAHLDFGVEVDGQKVNPETLGYIYDGTAARPALRSPNIFDPGTVGDVIDYVDRASPAADFRAPPTPEARPSPPTQEEIFAAYAANAPAMGQAVPAPDFAGSLFASQPPAVEAVPAVSSVDVVDAFARQVTPAAAAVAPPMMYAPEEAPPEVDPEPVQSIPQMPAVTYAPPPASQQSAAQRAIPDAVADPNYAPEATPVPSPRPAPQIASAIPQAEISPLGAPAQSVAPTAPASVQTPSVAPPALPDGMFRPDFDGAFDAAQFAPTVSAPGPVVASAPAAQAAPPAPTAIASLAPPVAQPAALPQIARAAPAPVASRPTPTVAAPQAPAVAAPQQQQRASTPTVAAPSMGGMFSNNGGTPNERGEITPTVDNRFVQGLAPSIRAQANTMALGNAPEGMKIGYSALQGGPAYVNANAGPEATGPGLFGFLGRDFGFGGSADQAIAGRMAATPGRIGGGFIGGALGGMVGGPIGGLVGGLGGSWLGGRYAERGAKALGAPGASTDIFGGNTSSDGGNLSAETISDVQSAISAGRGGLW